MRSTAAAEEFGSPGVPMRWRRCSAIRKRTPAYAHSSADRAADEPPQSVENSPGSISVTSRPATSPARACESPSRAHFDASYAPIPGNAALPPIEDTCRMWPEPSSRMKGSAACVTHIAPKTLVSICARNSASLSSSTKPKWP